jgi:signal transduction histidine kinase/DNA-binding response OmpR family regulator
VLIVISIIYYTWKLQSKRLKIKHEFEMSKFEAEKLHEVDEMKSRFFANISHEFRTPLTLIFGPAKDIIDKSKDTEIKQSAGLIKRNASRLYSLVNQLLDLSKLEAGKMTLEISEQNIIPLLKGLVLSFTSLAERKKIKLQFNTIEENLSVYVDKDKVEKIVNNLLSNAFKFTPVGGVVIVSVSKPTPFIPLPGGDLGVGPTNKVVEISIRDTGIGIAKERIDKIFDRFYQVDGSHSREGEGTGIGLALTKELVALHKGKIVVESEYGKGTTFKILLPLGKYHPKPEEIVEKEIQEETVATVEETELISEMDDRKEKTDIDVLLETDLPAAKAGKPLLLIVEDNSDVRKYVISHLEDDYRIQNAVDGEDGLQEALNHIPDLIISDIMMPKMDGFELCEKLKTDERTSHIPVILLTAKATNKDKTEGYETGADDYIMKPFDAVVLKVRIKNLIEQRRKLREHFKKEGLIELEDKEITSIDKKFLQKAVEIINEHLSDTSFYVEILADEISMSRRNLDRKLIALTGESPSDIIKRVRLARASKLLVQKFGNISEIALEVGFSNPAYFSKCFREQFGLTPSEYETNHSL